jgi:5S rRNA maturation endonuclease (ribonuclease M5)
LAETLGLRKYSNKKKEADDYIDPAKYRKGLMDSEDEEGSEEGFEKDYADLEFFDFQTDEWRGVPTSFLDKLGCKFAFKQWNDSFYVFMPVLIKGVMQGYVKAELEKPEPVQKWNPKLREHYMQTPPSYVNAPGKWSKEYGLLFYDYAVKLMESKGLSTLVLCEGPRDAIRLLRNGIPAIAVLGAGNWNEKKRYQLDRTKAENLILFMDGDDAGKAATKTIYKDVKDYFSTKYMSLWKYAHPVLKKNGKPKKDADGKVIMQDQWDPGNCPKRFIRQVKTNLK